MKALQWVDWKASCLVALMVVGLVGKRAAQTAGKMAVQSVALKDDWRAVESVGVKAGWLAALWENQTAGMLASQTVLMRVALTADLMDDLLVACLAACLVVPKAVLKVVRLAVLLVFWMADLWVAS